MTSKCHSKSRLTFALGGSGSTAVAIVNNKPVLDLSNNMRHVLVPADTRPGTIIYRLRASDADDDYPLDFKIYGERKGFSPLFLGSYRGL